MDNQAADLFIGALARACERIPLPAKGVWVVLVRRPGVIATELMDKVGKLGFAHQFFSVARTHPQSLSLLGTQLATLAVMSLSRVRGMPQYVNGQPWADACQRLLDTSNGTLFSREEDNGITGLGMLGVVWHEQTTEATEYVDEIAGAIHDQWGGRQSEVSFVPLNHGGGMKMRIVEFVRARD